MSAAALVAEPAQLLRLPQSSTQLHLLPVVSRSDRRSARLAGHERHQSQGLLAGHSGTGAGQCVGDERLVGGSARSSESCPPHRVERSGAAGDLPAEVAHHVSLDFVHGVVAEDLQAR